MQKKITITVPDEVIADLEELGKSFDMSLDEVYLRAAKNYIFVNRFSTVADQLAAEVEAQGIVVSEEDILSSIS